MQNFTNMNIGQRRGFCVIKDDDLGPNLCSYVKFMLQKCLYVNELRLLPLSTETMFGVEAKTKVSNYPTPLG